MRSGLENRLAAEGVTIAHVIAFVVLLVLGADFAGYLRVEYGAEYTHATLQQLMDGTAATPFQFRMLAPSILGLICHAFPMELTHLVRYYESLCFLLTAGAIALFAKTTGLPSVQAAMTGFAYLFVLPFLFVFQPLARLYFPSDSLSVVFWALSLAALASDRKWTFLLLFLLGMFNRESIVLVFLLGALYLRHRCRAKQWYLFVASGLLVFTAVRLVLYLRYGSNPGAGFVSLDKDILHKGLPSALESSRYYSNFLLLNSFGSASRVASVFGFLWIPALACRDRIVHPFLRMSVWLIPLYFVITFFVGNIDESRVFCDLAPIVLVSMVHIGRSPPAPTSI